MDFRILGPLAVFDDGREVPINGFKERSLLAILLLASVVIGGLASLSGALFGALVYEFLPIYAQEPPLVHFGFGKQAPAVVFGVLLILIMYAFPSGIAGAIRRAVATPTRSA